MDRRDLLLTNGQGELRAVVGGVRSDLRRQAGNYKILLETEELLMLRRSSNGEVHPTGRVLMAGQLITHSTVLEIINVIASSRWAGKLEIHGRGTLRILGFFQGVLRHAASDHPEDRLDKVLCRTGALAPSQIESVVRDIGPDRRFGELLVDRGLIDRRELFSHLSRQMEQILLAAVLEDEGAYLFSVFDEADESAMAADTPPATAHIPLQRLLLTAAERVDRVATFRKFIPDSSACPEALPGVEVTKLSPKERLVLGYATGERSLRQIASESWLGTFETLETAYQLLRRGHLQLRSPDRGPEELAKTLVEPFNRSLAEVYRAVEAHGEPGRVRDELDAWIGQSAERAVLGQHLGEDGLVDPRAVTLVLTQSKSRHQIEAIEDTLHSLTSFALFSASLTLPRADEERLTRRIHQRLKALQNGR